MRPMMLGILVSVFACGEFFILESNTQDDANHAPMRKVGGVAGLMFTTRVVTAKDGEVSVVVVARNTGEGSGKKVCRIRLEETPINTMSRMMPTLKMVWSGEVEVDLAVGEERTFEFSHPRFASLRPGKEFSNLPVLSELVITCGKERATIYTHTESPFSQPVPANALINVKTLPEGK